MMSSERNKAVFLDRDGVINTERGDYTWLTEDFRFVDGLFQALGTIADKGYLLIVISNQSGIGKGLYTRDDVEYLHAQMLRHFMLNRIPVTEIYYCPHHPSVSRCICRKPDSLLLEKAIARFRISAKASFFIGDAGRDMEAASRVGVKGIRVEPNSNLAEILPLIP